MLQKVLMNSGNQRPTQLFSHSEKKVVPATRNLSTNSASTMYYKVVITTMNK